jgi:hypothetical protein
MHPLAHHLGEDSLLNLLLLGGAGMLPLMTAAGRAKLAAARARLTRRVRGPEQRPRRQAVAVVAAQVAELSLGERFCGPPGSANGGYACGSIAGLLGGGVEVTLRRPPPLGRPLRLRDSDGVAVLHDGDELVAEAHPATVALAVPGTASPAEARQAAERYPLFQGHPFPTCFTCGPDRAAGDGLRIFPGPVPGGDLWAAPWTPDPSVADQDGLVAPEGVWAALDCPGGFAAGVGDTVMVLGRMAARVLARPRAGRAYCLLAWRGGPAAGRKQPAGSALLDGQGRVLAVARAVWVAVPRPEPAA